MMDLRSLNDRQKEAIVNSEGPTLVVAGAGSGKTRVLTYKIASLIDNGVSPFNILAITFTNKAAKEMKERIMEMIGTSAYDATIATFHSFGVKILRREIDKLGYSKSFTIIDGNDQLSVVKLILKDKNIDSKKYNPRHILSRISKYKNQQVQDGELEEECYSFYDEIVVDVYKKYCERLVANNCVDFDDLLILPVKLFSKFPDILEKYQNIFQYILVDEYQDTNSLQYNLVKMLGSKYRNIFVVGDGDQSIYSWRGANMENILNFEKDYQDANVILLEQNYRSTKNIIAAANNVIENNKYRKHKHLFTDNEEGEFINYLKCSDEKEEAQTVIDEVIGLLRRGVSLNEIAILYRTNAQSRVFEEVLLRENIAYNIVGSYYFYARKEIKDVLAYLRLVVNINDDISFLRVVNEPKRGIGNSTIEKLREIATGNNISLMEAIDLSYLSSKANQALSNFKSMIINLQEYSNEHSITHIIERVMESTGYFASISDDSIESSVRREYLEEFLSVANVFEETHEEISLEEFLAEISLVADMKQYEESDNKLSLMTLHAVKGLEFDYVFLVGMEEGLLPHRNSLETEFELEEERRLCYVGITRARKKLYFSNAHVRMFLGSRAINPISRFIKEAGFNLIEQNGEVMEVKTNFEDKIYDLESESVEDLVVGDKVSHDMFGNGIIVSIDGNVINVAFGHQFGVKKISALFNSLEKVVD
ncbi:MAG: ATP-dependent helicase [Bacilli bacterium]